MSQEPTISSHPETLAAEEAALLSRETKLRTALEDADLEASEVRAFASDVRVRLLRHAEGSGEDVQALISVLDHLDLPEFSAAGFEKSRYALQVEALRARQALVKGLEAALDGGHARIDRALERVREARDLMMRGRLRRPPAEAPADDATIAGGGAPAIAASPPARGAPTRTTERPVEVAEPVTAANPILLRASPRRKLETHVDFRSDSNFFSGFSTNISDGGLFIATYVELPVGSEFEVSLTLPEAESVRAGCIVRWSRKECPDLPAGLGVEFVTLDEASRAAIDRFMQRRDPIFHEI